MVKHKYVYIVLLKPSFISFQATCFGSYIEPKYAAWDVIKARV
jgi:hypothetical protein